METVNGCLSDRLDEMEAAIRKTSFRKRTGRANEVNYWVFDYPPEKELEVRARIEYMKGKNARGDDDFDLVVFDLYDVIIDFLEKKRFLEKCYDFEKKNGMERVGECPAAAPGENGIQSVHRSVPPVLICPSIAQ